MSDEHICNCDGENCDCGHHHDNEQMETIILSLDDNTELECYILGIFECDDQEYIALLPIDDEDVFVYRYQEGENGEPILDVIEDDDEYDRVGRAFYEIIEEKENSLDE